MESLMMQIIFYFMEEEPIFGILILMAKQLKDFLILTPIKIIIG